MKTQTNIRKQYFNWQALTINYVSNITQNDCRHLISNQSIGIHTGFLRVVCCTFAGFFAFFGIRCRIWSSTSLTIELVCGCIVTQSDTQLSQDDITISVVRYWNQGRTFIGNSFLQVHRCFRPMDIAWSAYVIDTHNLSSDASINTTANLPPTNEIEIRFQRRSRNKVAYFEEMKPRPHFLVVNAVLNLVIN